MKTAIDSCPEYKDYVSQAWAYLDTYPEQRLGQAFCNYLSICGRTDLRSKVHGKPIDPWNSDDGEDLIPFLTFLNAHW